MTRYTITIYDDPRYPDPFRLDLPTGHAAGAIHWLRNNLELYGRLRVEEDQGADSSLPLLSFAELTGVEDPTRDDLADDTRHAHSLDDIIGYRVLRLHPTGEATLLATFHRGSHFAAARELAQAETTVRTPVALDNHYRCGCWSRARYPGDRGVIDNAAIY